jgi:hypothetical protein
MMHYYNKHTRFVYKVMLGMLLLAASSMNINAQVTVMVDDSGVAFTDVESHGSWENATNDLQAAIDAVHDAGGGTIWVAGGTYYPTKLQAADPDAPIPPPIDPSDPSSDDNPREASFVMASNVTVIGGFEGDETSLEERPSNLFDVSNRVTLSGDIGVPDEEDDNAYHVVLFPNGLNGVDNTAILQNIYITGGYANGAEYFASRGSGIHMREHGIVKQCVITENSSLEGGGGIYIYKGGTITESEISNNNTNILGAGILLNLGGTVTSCLIHSNHAISETEGNGGGVYFDSSSGEAGTVTHSVIIGNLSEHKGGGIGSYDGAFISNNLITNNKANGNGGGIYLQNGGTILNSTIVSNASTTGTDGIYTNTNGEILNTVIWNNGTSELLRLDATTIINYSAIEGGFSGENVTNVIALDAANSGSGTNPEFKVPVSYQEFPLSPTEQALLLSSNYRINLSSALLNAGTPDISGLSIPDVDLGGDPRITNSAIDIGAFEALYYTVESEVASGNGTISPTGPENILPGESVTFTLTPNTGYNVTSFLINTTDFTSQLEKEGDSYTYTVESVSENLSVSVNFDFTSALPGDNKEEEFRVYPIPADNQLFFEGVNAKSVKIYSADGKLAKYLKGNTGSRINISDLKKGLYILILIDKNDETYPVRFIKN